MSDETVRLLITQTAPILLGVAAILAALRKQTTTLQGDLAEVKKGVNGQTALLLETSKVADMAKGHEAGRAEAKQEGEEKAAEVAAAREGSGT